MSIQQAAAGPASGSLFSPGSALLLVDLQRDFIDGALIVPGGQQLVPLLNRLAATASAAGAAVVASVDWHPQGHVSFADSHPGKRPGDTVDVSVGGRRVTLSLFPQHCVAGSEGAGFAEELDTSLISHTVHKGTHRHLESLSAFFQVARAGSTGLAEWLRACGISRLFVCGVATEYCVRASVLDGLAEGFQVALLTDAVAGMDPEACRAALEEVQAAGAVLLPSAVLLGEQAEGGQAGGAAGMLGKAAALARTSQAGQDKTVQQQGENGLEAGKAEHELCSHPLGSVGSHPLGSPGSHPLDSLTSVGE